MSSKFKSEYVVVLINIFKRSAFSSTLRASRLSKQQNKLVFRLNSFKNGALAFWYFIRGRSISRARGDRGLESASRILACVAGVRRGREKGSSSAKRDREREARSRSRDWEGFPHSPPSLPRPPTPTIALRARTPLLPSPSNAGHAGYCLFWRPF